MPSAKAKKMLDFSIFRWIRHHGNVGTAETAIFFRLLDSSGSIYRRVMLSQDHGVGPVGHQSPTSVWQGKECNGNQRVGEGVLQHRLTSSGRCLEGWNVASNKRTIPLKLPSQITGAGERVESVDVQGTIVRRKQVVA